VALKLLRQRPGCVEEERARLLREARAASALSHPNIAVIYDVEESETPEGRVFLLAMEYVPGKTLAELSAEADFSLDQILEIIGQTADALAEAHARGVVHRDIKPSNLMVAHGRVKVLDFGLAQMQPVLREDDSTWTREVGASREAGWAGTPHYMSPEQALGHALDSRSDVFSLGIVFYELVAGRRPFEGDNVVQVANAILHHDPMPLPVRFTDPRMAEVERLLKGMLAKDLPGRIRDLQVVRADCDRLRSGALPVLPSAGALIVGIAGFANITRHAEDEWLGTGLLETVTTALQEVDGLEVWGRDRLRETLRKLGAEGSELAPEDVVELGRATGARWVLTGGFQRLGDQVRVTARVVEVDTGRVLRAIKSDGRLEEIFQLQDRIVAELVAGLRRSVSDAHEGEETKVVAAYQALSVGLLNQRADSYESVDRAILFFERALALDPEYSRAQIELGAAYSQKAEYLTAPELHRRSESILRRVLEAHPRLPRAWRELGAALVAQARVDEGLECLQRALSMAPEDPRVLGGLARALFIGRGEFARAAELYEHALARAPQSGWYWMQLSHCYALLRDFERGEPAARRAVELQEAFLSGQQGVQLVGGYMRLAHLLSLQEKFSESVSMCERELSFIERLDHALRSRIRIELSLRLGLARLRNGDEAGAQAAFAEGLFAFGRRVALGADEPFTRYYAGAIHALQGASDQALDLLESSIRETPKFVRARAAIEPEWERLRVLPRFQRLFEHTTG
jgi:serine/threonine-protein kinase